MLNSLVKDTLVLVLLVFLFFIFLAVLGCLFVGWSVYTCVRTYVRRWHLRSVVCSSSYFRSTPMFVPFGLLPKPACNWTWGDNKQMFAGVIVPPAPKVLAALPSSFAPSTVAALKADLKANGVKGYSKLKKADLLQLWYRYC